MKIGWIFQSRKLKDGRSNLQLQFSDGRGVQRPILTGLKLLKLHWDKDSKRVLKTHENHELINKKIGEFKMRIEDALTKFDTGNITFDEVIKHITGRTDGSSVMAFLDSYVLEHKSPSTYSSLRSWVNGFKKYAGITRELRFKDISDSLFATFYKNCKNLIDNDMLSPRTANNYLDGVTQVYDLAYRKVVYEPIDPALKKYSFDTTQIEQKKANTTVQIFKAINNIKRITDWQSCAYWLLMFAMRGLYPADIPRFDDSKIKNKQMKPNARNKKDWENNNIYLDHKRSKGGTRMYIKLYPEIIQLIEKLRYTTIYTYAGKKCDGKDIIANIDNRVNILDYDPKRNIASSKFHANLWKYRQNRFKKHLDSPDIELENTRKSFEQTAWKIKTKDGVRKYDSDLTSVVTGRKLSKKVLEQSYLNWQDEETMDLVDDCHYDVLKSFRWFELKEQLFAKLSEIVANGNASGSIPKWVLKRSAVFKNDKAQYITAVGFKDNNIDLAKAEWEVIDNKYKKYFKDSSIEEDFWVYDAEPKPESLWDNDKEFVTIQSASKTGMNVDEIRLMHTMIKKHKDKAKELMQEQKDEKKTITKVIKLKIA